MKVLYIGDIKDDIEKLEEILAKNYPEMILDVVFKRQDGIMKIRQEGAPFFTILDSLIQNEDICDLFIQISHLTKCQPVLFIGALEEIDKKKLPPDFYEVNQVNGIIKRPFVENQIISAIDKVLSDESYCEFEEVEIDRELLMPIKIKNFFRFKTLPNDVYIERQSTKKFAKIIQKDSVFPDSLVMRFIQKGVKNLFVVKNDYMKFAEKNLQSVLKILQTPKFNSQTYFSAQIFATSLSHEYIRNVGVTDFIVNLCKEVIGVTTKNAKSYKSFRELFDDFPFKQNDTSEQSIITMYLSEYLSSDLGWISENSRMRLGLASLLHDSFLPNEDLTKITSLNDPNLAMFSESDKKIFKEHPIRAAQVAQQFASFSEGDFVIIQHHEMPSGKGFPNGLNSHQINSISCVFILANNFIDLICQKGRSDLAIASILDNFSATYGQGNFKRPLQILKSYFEY